jgi:hypothetical protein
VARINIEDSVFRDDRFLNLVEKTGNRYLAMGLVFGAWSLAQRYWLKHKGVPKDKWPDELDVLVDVKLARTDTNGNKYVCGSREQFAWLDQKSFAGKSKSEKKVLAAQKNVSKARKSKQRANNEPTTEQERTTSSSSSSSSSSFSSSNSDSVYTPYGQKSEKPILAVNEIVAHYCELFKDRYGSNPAIRGKSAGILKRLTADVGEEKAKLFLTGYFSLPDAFLVKRKHPVELIESKINEITVFINSGKFTSQAEASQMDKVTGTVSQVERIRRGEL